MVVDSRKGIYYPESANFPILLFYAYNEAVCVWKFQTNWTKNEVIAYTS